jgi:hypothetical protein
MKIRFFRASCVAITCGALALAALVVPTAGAATSASSPASGVNMSGAPYWMGQDLVRGIALTHPTTPGAQPGGYVVDAWGALHEFGGAGHIMSQHYTAGQKTTHNVALEGLDRSPGCATPDSCIGVTMNASAKTWLFPKGTAFTEAVSQCGETSSLGVPMRGISYDPAPTTGGQYNVNGATLDAWGGIHPFCGSGPIDTTGAPYWPNWQIAYGIALLPNGKGGFTLDGWGGVKAWGKARIVTPSDTYWAPRAGVRAWNIARGIAIDNTGTTTQQGNGIVADGWGGLHPFTYDLLP